VSFSALEHEDGEEGQSTLEALPDREPLPEEMTESNELYVSLHAAIAFLFKRGPLNIPPVTGTICRFPYGFSPITSGASRCAVIS
jgi:hypothetical protein